MLDFEHARHRMVEAHIARRGVHDRRVLNAVRRVAREQFVDEGFEEFAYEDSPLPIGSGQTISQPFIVAKMAEIAEIEATDRVLEIGTGSGYAAAVLAELAEHVFTIERHRSLAQQAERRLNAAAYRNIEVRVGDGTKGWQEKAPFDAIVVAAAGTSIPLGLQEQLEIGGRLIIPVGEDLYSQRLVRVTRIAANKFEEEDLGGVMFVPLIGEHGGHDENASVREAHAPPLPQQIARAAEDLPQIDDPAFGAMFDRFGSRRVVLLGEASHGTSEFYRARAAVTRRLLQRHGFTIVAVEADWPDAAQINRYVRGGERRSDAQPLFQRFPTWMWRNAEVSEFVGWLHKYNRDVPGHARKAGFYGLDLYNMSGSIATVLAYLDKVDPEAAAVARERYGCLMPWQNEPSTYGRAALRPGYRTCEEAVVRQCMDLFERSMMEGDGDLLDAKQSARLVASAERYYRVMYYGGAETWNLRDRHMFETLDQLLEAHGPESKAVVWAHNSHIGDARHTDMGTVRDELNIGQLCRERFGAQAALIGFGTDTGTVACASDWDREMEVKDVNPSLPGSFERLCHESGKLSFLLDFERHGQLGADLAAPRPERYIGVIYRPETERLSHYMDSSVSRQFDAFVWFDRTSAVTPLSKPTDSIGKVPDTFPFGI
ncbi:protein-L-isoaspartate(D-aspartate) O-methyltransferase [Mesorhizobium sp. BR115XR7A]|uniref:protein-L-isoaspartate(D-aspartate) O-methyltransferase n=1 Tax=Mesorhizobium sp. BR115XR7A TaxID=2876645 RepID=UPI001CD12A5D|nr:protein-L-isoaspartate(D-aspartate) O-methyltransferase [Mesorhizobium sp. BR115XR7A]MBZ9907331.1 protein-L-isoaspartate(D-aspartate) O-methyltransferase [Mesorhizobium sp. BR115XR7A]